MTYDLCGADFTVPRGGFKWKLMDVPAVRPGDVAGEQWVLVHDEDSDRPGRSYNPLQDPALFRNFASLDFNDRGAVLDFANRYGWLDLPRLDREIPRVVLDRDKPPSAEEVLTLYRSGSLAGLTQFEPYRAWAREVFELRLAVEVWDCFERKDRACLAKYLTYGSDPYIDGMTANIAAALPAGERAEFDRLTAELPKGEGWSFDTHRGRPVGEEPFPGRVRDRVSLFQLPQLAPIADRLHAGDILTPAGVLIWKWANSKVEGAVLTRLMHLRQLDRLGFVVVPITLAGAVWLQFMQAVDKKREYKRCRECGLWFAIAPAEEGGVSRHREFCSEACKSRDYRKRRDRARQLKAEGKTLPQIVKALEKAKLATDIETVKKWITKTRG